MGTELEYMSSNSCVLFMTPSFQPIQFFHRGRIVEISDAAPTRSVLDWLREDAHCTGTKEGCNEGDCGACTVVLGELVPGDGPGASSKLTLKNVNACIQLLPMLHGKALFTVEDLKPACASRPGAAPACHAGAAAAAAASPLHPVQQALVDCHGSQCGFCTPGFAMAMWCSYEQHQQAGSRASRQQMADALAGNLCRCTGYRPILDAGERMFDLPAAALNRAPVIEALCSLHARLPDEGLSYQARSDHAAQPSQRFWAPRTVQRFAQLRVEHPQARVVAGNTDIGLWVNKQHRALGDLLSIANVDELRQVRWQGDVLHIGAAASLESAFAALAQAAPALKPLWLRFAAPAIRHSGTLGGNVANGSPIGDAPPALLALDAELELRRGEVLRRLPLADFYLDYMKNALQAGEFVQALRVPRTAFARQLRAYKISKRHDCDISAVCAVFALTLEGGVVQGVRLALGGMAGIVKRAAGAEAQLLGRPWDAQALNQAQAALAHDFQPLSDQRASAAYRLRVAQNLLYRFWLETRPQDALPSHMTQVYSALHEAA